MYQAKLFENQNTKPGQRHYGGSIHYHFVSSNSSVGAYGGAKMVHSSITEMIANVRANDRSVPTADIANVQDSFRLYCSTVTKSGSCFTNRETIGCVCGRTNVLRLV